MKFLIKLTLLLNCSSIFRNWVLNFSILFETGLAVLFVYTPGFNTVLNLSSVIGKNDLSSNQFNDQVYFLIKVGCGYVVSPSFSTSWPTKSLGNT